MSSSHRWRRLRRRSTRTILRALPPVVRLPNFRRLWIGQGISQFGDAMYYMVFLFMVDKLTKSSDLTGSAGALMQLPYVILGFFVGVVADRFDRRLIMLFSDFGSAILMVLLLIFVMIFKGAPPGWLMLLIGFSLASISAFFDPARTASIPGLVPPEQLIEANGLSTSTRNLMQLSAPMASTIVLPILESANPKNFFALAILVNCASFLYSAFCIGKLPPLKPLGTDHEDHRPGTVLHETVVGMKFIQSVPILRIGLGLTLMVNLMTAPIYVAYIAANREWFGGSAATNAGIQCAFFMGMMVSGLYVIKFRIKKPGMSYCYGICGAGVMIALLGYIQHYWGFLGVNFLCGLAVPFAVIPLSTYLQLIVPDNLRGRVNSTLNMATNILLALGWLLAGKVIATFGISHMLTGLGGLLVVTGLSGFLMVKFREVEMPTHGPVPSPLNLGS